MPTTMDDILVLLEENVVEKELSLGEHIINYLDDRNNSIACSDMRLFIDSIIAWLKRDNPKVAMNGIKVLTHLVLRLDSNFKDYLYLSLLLPYLMERMGDVVRPLREKSRSFLMLLMMKDIITPNDMFKYQLIPSLREKNKYIREEVVKIIEDALLEFGRKQFNLEPIIPHLVDLLNDPSQEVQGTNILVLTHFFRHFGETFRSNIKLLYKGPEDILIELFEKFDAIVKDGLLIEGEEEDFYPFLNVEAPPPKVASSTKLAAGSVMSSHYMSAAEDGSDRTITKSVVSVYIDTEGGTTVDIPTEDGTTVDIPAADEATVDDSKVKVLGFDDIPIKSSQFYALPPSLPPSEKGSSEEEISVKVVVPEVEAEKIEVVVEEPKVEDTKKEEEPNLAAESSTPYAITTCMTISDNKVGSDMNFVVYGGPGIDDTVLEQENELVLLELAMVKVSKRLERFEDAVHMNNLIEKLLVHSDEILIYASAFEHLYRRLECLEE